MIVKTMYLDIIRNIYRTTMKKYIEFADDASLFESGIIKRDWVGCTQPNEHRFDKIKEIVGKAGIHGSWFGWFGRFNQPGEGRIDHIYDIPHSPLAPAGKGDTLLGQPLRGPPGAEEMGWQ
jgi:hypothetical protein